MEAAHKSRLIRWIIIAAVILIADQATKLMAVDQLKGQDEISYLGGTVRLIYAENTGAWGSLGEDWPQPWKTIVMTIVPLLVLTWIGVRMVRDATLPAIEGMAYALIISGGVGNIIDRLRLGYVVDFMWMGLKPPLTTNIFNIADLAIVGAIVLLVVEAIRAHREKKKQVATVPKAEEGSV